MSQYEIEIKSLLGSQDNADRLRKQVEAKGGTLLSENSQLNHYFIVPESGLGALEVVLVDKIPEGKKESLAQILEEGSNYSVRTREVDGTVLLVIKASIGDDTSDNGVSRMEFEAEMDMSLGELDQLLLDAGLSYQAKWSRAREEYKLGDTHICLDKNAGYGYLAEFERVVADGTLADQIKEELLGEMAEFGVEELAQDRLERMFAHYNSHWEDYYGTDKVFNIE